ncbi:MAG: flagellar basal body-associated FliL family protein [Atribacterota bacterium]|nr:flagellar basal body-associated FliL family protein [Atribacterota bacterium]
MAEEKEETSKETGKKGFSFKTLILILVVAMVGFMAFTYLKQSGFLFKKSAETSQEVKKKGEESIYIFEGNFLVNLLDPDNPRYLKLVLGVGFSDKKVENEIKKKNVELRDAIITVASAQTFEELAKPEGKERLKSLILNQINGILTTGQVEKVYFLDFVIQ